MRVRAEVDEPTLKRLVLAHLREALNVPLDEKGVRIEVKSKQNYKSEWEDACYRAVVEVDRG